jgi:hypothetical protein
MGLQAELAEGQYSDNAGENRDSRPKECRFCLRRTLTVDSDKPKCTRCSVSACKTCALHIYQKARREIGTEGRYVCRSAADRLQTVPRSSLRLRLKHVAFLFPYLPKPRFSTASLLRKIRYTPERRRIVEVEGRMLPGCRTTEYQERHR